MFKTEIAGDPQTAEFTDYSKLRLDAGVANIEDGPVTMGAGLVMDVGWECGAQARANFDGKGANAVRESLVANMSTTIISGFCHGFQSGWNQEALAQEQAALQILVEAN